MGFSELFNKFNEGVVIAVLVRPGRLAPMTKLNEVMAIAETGLDGDRYHSKGGSRQVTLIQDEHLNAVGSFLNRSPIEAELTRRNIVIRGINLLSLKGKRFRVGKALLEYSGECHPCSRMEQNLGEGGYNAMRGHGGITARIIESGTIRIGDAVIVQ